MLAWMTQVPVIFFLYFLQDNKLLYSSASFKSVHFCHDYLFFFFYYYYYYTVEHTFSFSITFSYFHKENGGSGDGRHPPVLSVSVDASVTYWIDNKKKVNLNSLCLVKGATHRGSRYIQPELSQSQLSFKDLFLDPDTGRASWCFLV